MWNKIFSLDNVVWQAIDTIGKIFLLNILWVICSLPIFTMGASTTALIYACMKLHHKEGYVTANFFKSFKENFKQSTIIFLIFLVIGVILGADMILGNQAGSGFGNVMKAAACIFAIPYIMTLSYVFGVQSRFVNTVKDTIRYSFFMAYRNMKYTIQMVILLALLVWVNTTVLLANFLTLVYGFGLLGYIFAAYYEKSFGKYLNPSEDEKIIENE